MKCSGNIWVETRSLGPVVLWSVKGGKKQNKKQREADKLLHVTSLRAKTSVPSGS